MKMMRMCGVVLLGLMAACGETTGPATTRAVDVVAVSSQQLGGVVGQAIDETSAVLVTDAQGSPIANVQVNWVITSGSGSITGGTSTGRDGIARATWTLGTTAGAQTLEARVGSLTAVVFTATAAADAPYAIVASQDSIRFDLPTDSLLLTANVVDKYGNVRPTGSVSWTSSDTSVLSVDAEGWVRAEGGGEASLSVTDGTLTGAVSGVVDMPTFSVPFVDTDLVVFFSAFGAPLSEQHDNVAYELYMDDDSMEVRSVSTGIVERVFYQEDTDDYEVFVRFSDSWLVLYDHLVSPAVGEGDSVEPGDLLGLVAYFGNYQVGMDLMPMGRIELQINYEGDREPVAAWCPALFGTLAFNAAHDAALARVSPEPATCRKLKAAP